MSTVGGSASTEIKAPIGAVYEILADVESSPRWQREIKVAECLERDADGNQVLVHMETDAKVRQIAADIRFNYEPPNRILWVQEKSDLKAVGGSWELEDLGEERTRVTYQLEVDLGRKLGLLIRGPLIGVLRGQLVDTMPAKLKSFVESGSS